MLDDRDQGLVGGSHPRGMRLEDPIPQRFRGFHKLRVWRLEFRLLGLGFRGVWGLGFDVSIDRSWYPNNAELNAKGHET